METTACAFYTTGLDHMFYEDRYRLLGNRVKDVQLDKNGNRSRDPEYREVPLAAQAGRGQIFAVMDGVGGAPRGMNAAQHTADRLTDFLKEGDTPASAPTLVDLVTAIDQEIYDWGFIEGSRRPLGAAAATVAWLSPSQELVIVHAGDTLAVHFDGEEARRLTSDLRSRKTISSYIGRGNRDIDCSTHRMEEGDLLCLVTNGVTKGLGVADIGEVLREYPDPELAPPEIISRARGKRSRDDITVVVVELEQW